MVAPIGAGHPIKRTPSPRSATGKPESAEIRFTHAFQMDLKDLRRWLKKEGRDIWDLLNAFPDPEGAVEKTTAVTKPIPEVT